MKHPSQNEHLTEQQMDASFLEAEKEFRSKATKLWETNRERINAIRGRVEDDQETREDAYRAAYQKDVHAPFERLASAFIESQIQRRERAHNTVYRSGVGDQFANHLVQLSSVPDEKLGEVLDAAMTTGQSDLARACAITAQQRQGYSETFEKWAKANPEIASALDTLRKVPGAAQLHDRAAKGMRPPKARPEQLVPTREDHERAAAVKAAKEAERKAFYSGQRRILSNVGAKTEERIIR